MSQILETVMLICFGISWPISLVKNLQIKTAVGTSPMFMFMIILGYVAGITAKFLSHGASYVLIAYFLNLCIVLANVAVYFRNRKLDRLRAQGGAKACVAATV